MANQGSGTRPKPTRLKVLEGNRGKRPLPPDEPQIEAGAPPCPAWLVGEARAEWDRMVAMLLETGLITRVDGAALAHYCDLHAQAVQIAAEMARPEYRPLVVEIDTKMEVDGSGEQVAKARPNPLVRMSLQIKQAIRLYLVEFGLTPSSRAKVKATPPAKSALAQFLGQKRA